MDTKSSCSASPVFLALCRMAAGGGSVAGRQRVRTLLDRKTLEGVTEYLYRNRARMRYHKCLAHGWPIASSSVEGACKNLIKDRMGRSGIRWTEQMAEGIFQLRAVYLSGGFDDYWQFHIGQDQKRLYLDAWKRRSKIATP